jgi:hypothetical protein
LVERFPTMTPGFRFLWSEPILKCAVSIEWRLFFQHEKKMATCQTSELLSSLGIDFTKLLFGVGKRSRIQLRTLLNKNDSVIECIFNAGASFYTTCEQRRWYKHKQRRSKTSGY